jgi:hypothetical protein
LGEFKEHSCASRLAKDATPEITSVDLAPIELRFPINSAVASTDSTSSGSGYSVITTSIRV